VVLGGYIIKKNHDGKFGFRHHGFISCNIKKNQDDELHSSSWFLEATK
jgi:hypothetical protein